MKIETNRLSGSQLAWAVAKCRGYAPCKREKRNWSMATVRAPEKQFSWTLLNEQEYSLNFRTFAPESDWAQGGPILDKAGITTGPWTTSPAMAHYGSHDTVSSTNPRHVGKDQLEAGMRCLVFRHFGDEMDIPKELS